MIRVFFSRPSTRSIAAAAVGGVAMWLSRASFDVAGTFERPTRVAMLPGLSELAGLIVLALLLAAGLASLLRDIESGRFWSVGAADALTPLFALSLIALPFLPWIADWMPALRLLAGPGRMLLWIVVVGQVVWIVIRGLSGPAKAGHYVLVFVVSLAVYYWTHAQLANTADVPWALLCVSAVISLVAWGAGYALTRSRSAATFGWAAVCLTAPYMLNSGDRLAAAMAEWVRLLAGIGSMNFPTTTAHIFALLFDQEFGIFAYAPILLLGFIGLGAMMRQGRQRVLAVNLAAASFIVITIAATREPWWNRSMMPGATVVLLLPFLAVPIAWLYAGTTGHLLRRAAAHALLLSSIGLAVLAVSAGDRMPLPQEGDGSSSVLVWLSPSWQLTANAPSFITDAVPARATQTAIWLAGFCAVGWLLSRKPRVSIGKAALLATTVIAAAVVTVISISAAVSRQPRFNAEGRAVFPMLEDFNPTLRPIALSYDPMTVVASADLPARFSLSAVPGQRRDRQPVRVVLNTRFRLPAGEYDLEVKGSPSAAAPGQHVMLALQIGRDGPPLETWPLTLAPGASVHRRFRVPLDAEFVGFRASRDVERAIAELRLRVMRVEPSPRRFRTPTVRAAADFRTARAFFHDGNSYAERDGFWVKGLSTTRVTLEKTAEQQTSFTLAIHSGARPNTVTLATADWTDTLELVPGTTRRVVVPATAAELFVPVEITAARGFVPSEVEPGNRDRRLLGAWIAFIPDDTSRTSEVP